MKCILWFFCCMFTTHLTALLDLDAMQQSFIVEAKQINIPGYPDAFNPSIIRWNDQLLMTFRSRDPTTNIATIVGFVWLDEDFNLIGTPQLLEIPNEVIPSSYIQDPRLCIANNILYMAYSDLWEDPKTKMKHRKMYISQLEYDGMRFFATRRDCFLDFKGDPSNPIEKNWVPFDYQDSLLLSYSIAPHKVFFPWIGKSKCLTFSLSQQWTTWRWGTLRGGTPALRIDDNHYLAFFHSSEILPTVQSNKKSITHYFMGAYVFEAQPPFSIQKISPTPIVHKTFYNGPVHRTWKPLRVVFPCGFIQDKNYIWVSYGRQDHEAWIVKLDKAKLLNSLVPFTND